MRNRTRKHVGYILIIILYVWLITALGLGCAFLRLFGFPCPTCGVCRALLCLTKFDIKGYFNYNPTALPLIVSVWLALHEKLFRRKRVVYAFIFTTLALNAIIYALKFLS